MKCELIPVTRDNLDVLAKLAADKDFNIVRSKRWFERLLFNDAIEEFRDDPVRGYMLKNEKGEYVGMQCFYPVRIYLRQDKKLAVSGAILGMKRRYVDWLGDIAGAVISREGDRLRFGNTIASKKAARISTFCSAYVDGPHEGECTRRYAMITFLPIAALRRVHASSHWVLDPLWLLTHPLRVMKTWMKRILKPKGQYLFKELSSFSDERFGKLWKRILAANDGVMSSREPEILRHYFDASIAAGTVDLIVVEGADGEFQGYVLLRKYRMYETRHILKYKIIDICCVANDVSCLRQLVEESVIHAERHGGGLVEYIGANPNLDKWLDPILKHRRIYDHPTFMYYCPDSEPEMKQLLENGKGWFFGPYDGERCLGHGEYIDL